MENGKVNNEARTSYQVSSSQYSSSVKNSPQNNSFPDSAGTKVSLKGKIKYEMENALILDVAWKGKNYAGVLIKVSESHIWGPQRLRKYPQLPAKNNSNKIWNGNKIWLEKGSKNVPRKQGLYSVKHPRSFVHSSNIVESKLRFGRGKKFKSNTSSRINPQISNFREDTCSSNVSDLNSLEIDDGLEKNVFVKLDETFDKSQLPSSELPEPSMPQNGTCFTKREMQCNDDNDALNGDNLVDLKDAHWNKSKVEMCEIKMPLLSRYDIYSENAENMEENLNGHTSKDREMPKLLPFKSASTCPLGLANSYAKDINHNVSTSTTNIIEIGSDLGSTSYLTAAVTSDVLTTVGKKEILGQHRR